MSDEPEGSGEPKKTGEPKTKKGSWVVPLIIGILLVWTNPGLDKHRNHLITEYAEKHPVRATFGGTVGYLGTSYTNLLFCSFLTDRQHWYSIGALGCVFTLDLGD